MDSEIIEALHASRNISIINLQYADNTLLFGRFKMDQAIQLKWILHMFELWSRLRINFNKSQLLFLGERDLSTKIIEKIMDCKGRVF